MVTKIIVDSKLSFMFKLFFPLKALASGCSSLLLQANMLSAAVVLFVYISVIAAEAQYR